MGALVDGNARLGPKPGDPASTDPAGLISQLCAQTEKSGGFLEVTIRPGEEGRAAVAAFTFYDERGVPLYSAGRAAME